MLDDQSYLKAMRELDEFTKNARLRQACIDGDLEKVNLLLDHKDLRVDMYAKDLSGSDAFHWACAFNHPHIVQELLFKYDYKVSKRNLNRIISTNKYLKGALNEILNMIESKETQLSLNKSVKSSSKISDKKNKI